MENYQIQQLRELPVEGVAKRLGLSVKKHKCLCCFHDDHSPSLYFNIPKNSFRCFSCGAHGNAIDLAMKILGIGFVKTCEWLASENNIIVAEYKSSVLLEKKQAPPFDASRFQPIFENPSLSSDARRFLYDRRHLHPAVVKFCRLNSFHDWLQIPYYDQRNHIIGIQCRYMGNNPSRPRFIFQRGNKCHLYNQQIIPMLLPGEPVYIGEGPSDVWALLSSGKKAVGIPSATLLNPHDIAALTGRECHIYPDKDAAGESLYSQLVSASSDIGFSLVRHDLPEGCKDFSDYWVGIHQALPVTSLPAFQTTNIQQYEHTHPSPQHT